MREFADMLEYGLMLYDWSVAIRINEICTPIYSYKIDLLYETASTIQGT